MTYPCGMDIEYSVHDEKNLDLISGLWEKLRDHHALKNPVFAASIKARTFGDRKKELLGKAKSGKLRIDLATDGIERRAVGYCVSSITGEGEGEIDSLFIEEDYRGRDLGDNLVGSAMNWLESQVPRCIRIQVIAGNEEVLRFYENYGFKPRTYTLEKVNASDPEKLP